MAQRTCPNGHIVPPFAHFCPACGARVRIERLRTETEAVVHPWADSLWTRLKRQITKESLPPLAEIPESVAAIMFDAEEQDKIDTRWQELINWFREESINPSKGLPYRSLRVLVAGVELCELAKSRLDKGDFRRAASSAGKAVVLIPDVPDPHILMARAHMQYGALVRAGGYLIYAGAVALEGGNEELRAEELARIDRLLGLVDDMVKMTYGRKGRKMYQTQKAEMRRQIDDTDLRSQFLLLRTLRVMGELPALPGDEAKMWWWK